MTDTKSGQSSTIKIIVQGEATSYLSCPDNNHPHLIDLGLPSGTLWACCNVGADKPEAYGGYYAWGEMEEKSQYIWETYIYCDGTYHTDSIGNIIGKDVYGRCIYDIAGTQYDVAHVKWGGSWVMPSFELICEFLRNCTFSWKTMNGIKGGQFTGSNGGTIFLPAADYRYNLTPPTTGSFGGYWSSTQPPEFSSSAYILGFDDDLNRGYYHYMPRYDGVTVRPIWVP